VQMIGVVVGAVVAVPVFMIVKEAWGLGTEELPAVAGVVWASLARLVSAGWSALPRYAVHGVFIAGGVGVALALLDGTRLRHYLPSAVGVGVAMVVPAIYSISMFLGSMLHLYLKRRNPQWFEDYYAALASGGIAGEGLVAVLAAALIVTGLL